MGNFDPVRTEAVSFFDRARKAVTAAFTAVVATFGTTLAAQVAADGFDPSDVVRAGVAAAVAGLAGLGVVYQSRANVDPVAERPRSQ